VLWALVRLLIMLHIEPKLFITCSFSDCMKLVAYLAHCYV